MSVEPARDADLSAWEVANAAALRRIALIVLLAGLFWRVFRYLAALPFYGDETMLMVNYLAKSYGDIFGPIDGCQIAPLFFHWGEIAVLQTFGSSEWSMRLPPLLGSILGAVLFWRLARETLSPLGHAIAVSCLAVSTFPVYMGSIVKPYSWDLLASVGLLLPFACWLNRRESARPLWLLALIGPLAAVSSYPSVFVAGAMGMVLLYAAWKSGRGRIVAAVLTYNALTVAAIAAHYWFVGRVHLQSPINGETTAVGMDYFWERGNGFPPGDPLRFLWWFVSVYAGELTAHPVGSQRGGSIVSTVICIIGFRVLWKQGRRELFWTFAGVFMLAFIAAALRKYPLGSGRLSQYAAPIVCLLLGLGGRDIVRRFIVAEQWMLRVRVFAALCILLAIGGSVWTVIKPYYDLEARWSRQASSEVVKASGDELLLLALAPEHIPFNIRWNLVAEQHRIVWGARESWPALVGERRSVWIVSCNSPAASDEETYQAYLSASGARWECVQRIESHLAAEKQGFASQQARAFRFVRIDPERQHAAR